MAVNLSELRTAIYTIINTLTGQETVWQNQNAPTPNGDYILLKTTGFIKIGNDWQGNYQECSSETQGDREFVLNIIAVSKEAEGILLDLIDKLELQSTLEFLTIAKMSYIDQDGSIIPLTTEINGSFETRAAVDLRFRISKNYSFDTKDNIKIVQAIQYAGDFTNSDITINETILN